MSDIRPLMAVEGLWRPPQFATHPAPRPKVTRRGMCLNVVDGDTFDALVEFGMDLYRYCRVRLKDKDCPEIFHPKSEAERSLGMEAFHATQTLLFNKPILLDMGSEEQTQGRVVAVTQYYDNKGWHDLGDYLEAHHLLKKDVVP